MPAPTIRLRVLRVTAAALLVLVSGCDREPMRGIALEPPKDAPPLYLADASGQRFDLDAQRGSVVMIFFGYTHCPDVCPTTLSDWVHTRRALGDDANKVQFVFVSVDPQRDTPEIARRYVLQFDSTFVGLSGSEAEIETLKASWSIAAYPEGDARLPSYTVAHPAYTFLVDRQGRLRYLYEPGVRGEELARDLRKLL